MRIGIFALVTLVLNIFSPLQADQFDAEADEKILHCMHSTGFSKMLVNYRFEGQEYTIRVMHNPQEEVLWESELLAPKLWSFMMIANVPWDLSSHLQHLISDLKDKQNCYIDLRGLGYISPYIFSSLYPVFIAETIDDLIQDGLVKKAFSSSEFVNEVFYYYLKDEFYRVRILHNPEGLPYSATKFFRLGHGAPLNPHPITWNYKYGIITDEKVPQELIDHLSAFTNASSWDWYFNFKICNGTWVEHSKNEYTFNGSITTTYSLDKWFNYTEELH